MSSSKNEVLEAAIKSGRIDSLKDYLDLHPEQATIPYKFIGGHGTSLHMAAYYNQPEICEYLVNDRKVNVNHREGVTLGWTPLLHAAHAKATEATAGLLELGAVTDYMLEREVELAFVRSEAVRIARDPEYRARARRKKIEGKWTLNAPQEVVHDYEWPDQGLRITDAFNYETRKLRSVMRDRATGNVSHADTYFDNMPDSTEIEKAFTKLRELGGEADETAISGRGLNKRTAQLPKPKS